MTLSLWLIQEGAYEPVETLNQYDFFEGDYTITQIKSQPSLYVTIFSSLTYWRWLLMQSWKLPSQDVQKEKQPTFNVSC